MSSSQQTHCACLTKARQFVILRETAAVCRCNQTDRTYSMSRIHGLGSQRRPQPILSAFFPTEYSITVVSFDVIDTEIPTQLIDHSVQRVATVWTVRGSNPDVDKTSSFLHVRPVTSPPTYAPVQSVQSLLPVVKRPEPIFDHPI